MWRSAVFLVSLLVMVSAPAVYAFLARSSAPWLTALLLSWALLAAAIAVLVYTHPRS